MGVKDIVGLILGERVGNLDGADVGFLDGLKVVGDLEGNNVG